MAQDSGQSFGGFLTTMVGGATAAGSIIAAVTAAFAFQGQIAGILWKPLHVPVPLQVWATIALMLLLLLIVFAIWYGAIRQESRIADRDRFTLRASNRETLLGRDKDVEALTRVVLDNRLVLLDGESGCGKSALVAVGLLPALADDPAWLPVLCSEWREDWECGPLVTVTDALFRALQKEGRDAVGWKKGLDLTLPAEDLARELARQLVAVRAKLGGRRVLLVLDQFDDYQAQHRDRFVVTDRTWLTATDLLAQNAFWACLHAALKAGDLHCVLVTRADAAGGFACVRFVDIKSAAMTLELVKADRAEPILKRLAPDDADPPVVIRPDKGWHQLREMLAKELEARRALLMQQLRVLVLGLRELPALTVGHFRAAGGMAGVEAFYIRRAIEASVENRGQEPIARALLAPLIDPGDGVGQPKTRTLPQSALIGADGETETKLAILKALAKGEIVRPVPQAGIDEPAWRLDHDYLARAVITDARRVNRLSVRLEDGRHAFDAASGSLRLQFQALLEPWSWLRIGMQALRRRIALGPAGRYYLISGIKPALVLALLGVPPAILWETERRAEVERVFTAIGTNNHPGAALLEVWRGPEWLRDRLFARLAAPGSEVLFKNAIANGWVMADIGWDVGRARRMADTLRGRIGPDLDPNVSGLYSQSLATTVVAVPDPKLWADTLVFLRSQNFSRTDRVAAYETVLNRITDQKILEGEFDHFMKLATAVDQKELDFLHMVKGSCLVGRENLGSQKIGPSYRRH